VTSSRARSRSLGLRPPDGLATRCTKGIDDGEVADDLVDQLFGEYELVAHDASVANSPQDRLKPPGLASNAAPHASPAIVVTGISQSQSSPAWARKTEYAAAAVATMPAR
jgi:hypothetical protein